MKSEHKEGHRSYHQPRQALHSQMNQVCHDSERWPWSYYCLNEGSITKKAWKHHENPSKEGLGTPATLLVFVQPLKCMGVVQGRANSQIINSQQQFDQVVGQDPYCPGNFKAAKLAPDYWEWSQSCDELLFLFLILLWTVKLLITKLFYGLIIVYKTYYITISVSQFSVKSFHLQYSKNKSTGAKPVLWAV